MHWRNSHFQIRQFIAGRAHTPDEAYRVLRELAAERAEALAAAEVSALRIEARREELAAWWRPVAALFWPGLRLRTRAERRELNNAADAARVLVAVAERELSCITALIDEVEPQRRYRHLPDHEADQAAQEEEWRLELMTRIENYLVATGTVPPEQLDVMRLHPAWRTTLVPHMRHVMELVEQQKVDLLPERKRLLLPEPPS